MSTVVVTGATGNVGQAVVTALVQRGVRVVAAERGPAKPGTTLSPGVTSVRLDFRDKGTWAPALTGATHLFLMRPPAIADVENNLLPFIDEARALGVDHVVFLSVAGAEKNRFVPHRKVEDHLRACGDRYTNLRPGFFAQNLGSAYRADIVEAGRIYVPAGTAPVNWIDVRDVADVAAVIFADPGRHRGQSYTLTGPGAVPWSLVTDALTLATRHAIAYEPASVLGYAWHLRQRGLPRGAILVQTILHFLLRFGQGAAFDPTLEQLLGRPGRGIEQYIADHAQLWRSGEPGASD